MKNIMAAIQWVGFMIAMAIAVPIALAGLFHMNPAETASFVQRTLFVLGVASFIQGLFGHRLPISEGPAGLWWVVFAIYAGFAGTIYGSDTETLQVLCGAMIVSGVVIIAIALFGLMEKIGKLFTPTVTFIYLLLLVLQLSGSLIKGVLGITSTGSALQPIVAVLSIITIFLTFWFGHISNRFVKQYSIILSLLVGWFLFAVFGLTPDIPRNSSLFAFPQIFTFGMPVIDSGAISTGIFIGFLLTTNMITSIQVMEPVIGKDVNNNEMVLRKGGIISGINLFLAGIFSVVGSVPLAVAAGFVSQTGLKRIKPFLIGGLIMCILSLFPPIINIISSIPEAVCYAVSFVVFARMVGLAFVNLDKVMDVELAYKVLGISLLTGVGCMFLPTTATVGLPVAISTVLNNGLVFGTIVGIIMEQLVFKGKKGAKKPVSI